MASLALETGGFDNCIAATSSHFCSAEKQFRFPLEYGGQRAPTAQWTVTGSGAAVLSAEADDTLPYIDKIHIGTIEDLGITDAANMGAAMAPAAADTIIAHLSDLGLAPDYYDAIITGDLGVVGSEILCDLIKKEGYDISSKHIDCGMILYDIKGQDVHAGASGCGCCASVLCGHFLPEMEKGKYKKEENLLKVKRVYNEK